MAPNPNNSRKPRKSHTESVLTFVIGLAIGITGAIGRLLTWPIRKCLRFMRFQLFKTSFVDHVIDYAPDIVHAHELLALPVGAAAAKATGAKLVYDSHELELHRNPPLPYFEKKQVHRIESRYIKDCDAVISVSEEISDYLRDLYKIERPVTIVNSPIVKISEHNEMLPAISSATMAGMYQDRDLRSEISANPNHVVCVYVGTVTINRGLEIVLRALRFVPSVHLVAVGRLNPEVWGKLERLSRKLGVDRRFEAVEPVHPLRVIDYIKDADMGVISVLPETLSYDWSMPNKLFEMTLAGLPILCSNTKSASQFVRENNLGQVYQAYDHMDCSRRLLAMSRTLDTYKMDPAKLEKLRAEYGWEVQEGKLLDLYSKL